MDSFTRGNCCVRGLRCRRLQLEMLEPRILLDGLPGQEYSGDDGMIVCDGLPAVGSLPANADPVMTGEPLHFLADSVGQGNAAPTVGSLSFSADPVNQPNPLTVTASGVNDPDGTVQKVEFYHDSDGNGTLSPDTDKLLGTDTDSSGGWSITVDSRSLPPGQRTVLARAFDDADASSNTVSASVQVVPPPGEDVLVLGPADLLAVDQPRVQFRLDDPASGPPEFFNSALLDSAANGILLGQLAYYDQDYEQATRGDGSLVYYEELGVAGTELLELLAPREFYFAGSDGVPLGLGPVNMLGAPDMNLGSFAGVVGMPAMAGNLTSMDLGIMTGEGPQYMGVDFPDQLPQPTTTTYHTDLTIMPPEYPGVQQPGDPLPTYEGLPAIENVGSYHQGNSSSSTFVLDTGAQTTIFSSQMAAELGIDPEADAVDHLPVGGVGGEVNMPLVEVENLTVPTQEGVDVMVTDLVVGVLDIPGISGVLGMNFLTSGYITPVMGMLDEDGYLTGASLDFTGEDGVLRMEVNPAYHNVISGGDQTTIGSFSADPDPLGALENLTLTADDIDPASGSVQSVEFYRDSNGNDVLDQGSDELLDSVAGSGGPWVSTISPPAWQDGEQVLFAIAVDEGSSESQVASTTISVDMTGPRVQQLTPQGSLSGPVSRVEVTFSEAIDEQTLGTDDISLVTPDGPAAISAVSHVSGNTYNFTFAEQSRAGAYTVEVGPDVEDMTGNPMDQDQDGTPGEVTDDRYSGSFSIENEPPVSLSLDSTEVMENEPVGTVVGNLSTGDPDAGDSFTYALVSGAGDADNGSFEINGDRLETAEQFDYETKHVLAIRVRTTDSAGQSYERQFEISVGDVNEAPTDIAISSAEVAENKPAGTPVGTLSTTDEDGAETFIYALVPGAGDGGNAFFVIDGAVLKASMTFDYETRDSYSVRVQARDSGGNTFEKQLAISIINEAEAPAGITLSSNHVAENQAAETAVGELAASDPDGDETFTYALVSGGGDSGNGSFLLDGATLKTAESFDYETKDGYSIRVAATDSEDNSYEETFMILVTDVNDTPTDLSLDSTEVAENEAAGTTVGTLSTTDQDADESFRYSLVSGEGDDDNGAFEMRDGTLVTTEQFDYEGKSSYSVRVQTEDSGGATYQKQFAISVTDVNEAPSVTLEDTTTELSENADTSAAVKVASIAVSDDALGNNELSLTGPHADLFEISGGSELMLRAGADLDYETEPSLEVAVDVDDSTVGGSPDDTASLTLLVTNANEVPMTIGLSAAEVAEHEPVGTTVGNLSAIDQDAGETFSYSLVEGAGDSGNDSFTIDGNTLKTAESFNWEVQNAYSIRVRATDSGDNACEEQFTVSVTDVNEVPTLGGLQASPMAVTRPQELTLLALNVDDPEGAVQTVQFYRDDGDGAFEPTEDMMLGSGVQSGEDWEWSGSTMGWAAGNHTYFARVQDAEGLWSAPATAQGSIQNARPQVTTFGPVGDFLVGEQITLHAAAEDADGSVTQVDFYRDLDGDGAADTEEFLGTGSGSPDDVSLTVPTIGWAPVTHTFIARAHDNDGDTSVPVTTAADAEFARIASRNVDGAMVAFYDVDVSNGTTDSTVAWQRKEFSPDTDIYVHAGRPDDQRVHSIMLLDDSGGTSDLGIVVEGNTHLDSLADKRGTPAALGFLASEGQIGVVNLRAGIQGANLNGAVWEGGWALPDDLDEDGETGDSTGIYGASGITRVVARGDAEGDVVAGGDVDLVYVLGGDVNGDVVLTGSELGRVIARGQAGTGGSIGGDIAVPGGIQQVMALNGDITGDIDADGDVSFIRSMGNIEGDIHAGGDLRVLQAIGGDIAGTVDVDGNLRTAMAYGKGGQGGSVSGLVDVDGDLHVLKAVNGGLSSGVVVDGNATLIQAVGGHVSGPVEIGGNLNTLAVHNGSLQGPVTTGMKTGSGDLKSLKVVNGDVRGSVQVSGRFGSLMAVGQSSGGNIQANVEAGNGLGILYATADLTGDVNVTGDLARMTVRGDIVDSSVEVNAGSLTSLWAGGKADRAVFRADDTLQSVFVQGDLTNTTVGAGKLGRLRVRGRISEDASDGDKDEIWAHAGLFSGRFLAADETWAGWVDQENSHRFNPGGPGSVLASVK